MRLMKEVEGQKKEEDDGQMESTGSEGEMSQTLQKSPASTTHVQLRDKLYPTIIIFTIYQRLCR